MRRYLLIAALMIIVVAEGRAQKTTRVPGFIRERSVGIFGGFSWPLGRGGFTEYWAPGPAAGIELSTRVSRQFSLGMGFNTAAYWFREGKFASNHPGVPTHNIPIAHISVELTGRLDLIAAKRVSPYLGFSVGAVRVTGAAYSEVINSVRVVYYDLPLRNHLTFGVNPGVDFRLGKVVAIDTEVKFMYVHDDPNVSWTAAARAGVRFIF